jgi:hypothetical protein
VVIGSPIREDEGCLALVKVTFDRENDDTRLESMPVVRDLGISTGCWLLEGEIGPRSRWNGLTFYDLIRIKK